MPRNPLAAQLIATTNTTNQIQTSTLAPTPPTLAQTQATRIRSPTQSRPLRPRNTQIYPAPRSLPHPHRLTRLDGSGNPSGSRWPQTVAQFGAGNGADLLVWTARSGPLLDRPHPPCLIRTAQAAPSLAAAGHVVFSSASTPHHPRTSRIPPPLPYPARPPSTLRTIPTPSSPLSLTLHSPVGNQIPNEASNRLQVLTVEKTEQKKPLFQYEFKLRGQDIQVPKMS